MLTHIHHTFRNLPTEEMDLINFKHCHLIGWIVYLLTTDWSIFISVTFLQVLVGGSCQERTTLWKKSSIAYLNGSIFIMNLYYVLFIWLYIYYMQSIINNLICES